MPAWVGCSHGGRGGRLVPSRPSSSGPRRPRGRQPPGVGSLLGGGAASGAGGQSGRRGPLGRGARSARPGSARSRAGPTGTRPGPGRSRACRTRRRRSRGACRDPARGGRCRSRPVPPVLRTWSQSASSARGMPARTRRGRSTSPWRLGAAGTRRAGDPRPLAGQRGSTAARRGRSRRAERRPGGRPRRAASTPKPMIRTWPCWSTRTFSGASRPWASPASWASPGCRRPRRRSTRHAAVPAAPRGRAACRANRPAPTR